MGKGAIEDATKPRGVLVAAVKQFDLQDALLLAGIVFWEIAAAVIWWPSALVLAGAFCLGFAILIEKTKANGNPKS